MAFRLALSLALFVTLALGAAVTARADTLVIDFENTPALPAGPSTFSAAGPMQVITVPGVATISGGVVLGNPTFLASFASQGSAPNAYGTADFGHPTLQPVITIIFSSGINVTEVGGVLFNGLLDPTTYTVNAFSGAALVASQTLTGVPDNNSPGGFATFSLSAPSITSVTFIPQSLTEFDYFLDSLSVTFTTQQQAPVPEPAAALLLGTGLAGVIGAVRRRRKSVRRGRG